MKKSLMSVAVAGSWVLWASTASAEITMKLSDLCGLPTASDAAPGVYYWQVEVGSGGYISDLSEDGTFTTDVPEGTKLSASVTGCREEEVHKPNQTISYLCLGALGMGPSSPWTPAKDGGVLIVSGEACWES